MATSADSEDVLRPLSKEPDLAGETKRHFDVNSGQYYQVVDATPFLYGYYHRKELSLIRASLSSYLEENHPKEKQVNVLDIGCATGRIIQQVQENAPNAFFVGLDISSGMIKLAKAGRLEAEFLVGDIRNLPFRDGMFDFVYSLEVMEHLDRKSRSVPLAVGEVTRVARDGACIILESTSSWHFRIQETIRQLLPGLHTSLYERDNLTKFSEAYREAPLTVAEPSPFESIRKLLTSRGAKVMATSWIRVVPEQTFILLTNDSLLKLLTHVDELLVRIPGLRRLGREFIIVSEKRYGSDRPKINARTG